MAHAGSVTEVSNLLLLSLILTIFFSLGSYTCLDLEGLLPAKWLMGDGCRRVGGVVKQLMGLGFDKATGPASRRCFIKRADL